MTLKKKTNPVSRFRRKCVNIWKRADWDRRKLSGSGRCDHSKTNTVEQLTKPLGHWPIYHTTHHSPPHLHAIIV